MEGDQEEYSAVLNFMVGQMNLQVLTEKFLWFVISSPFMSIYTNLLINLRSPRDCPSSGWVGRRVVIRACTC